MYNKKERFETMNKQEYLKELQGVTYDMYRDMNDTPSSETYLWYAAVGLDDDYLYDMFCDTWNIKQNDKPVEERKGFMNTDMMRHVLVTMYVLQEWPLMTLREVRK